MIKHRFDAEGFGTTERFQGLSRHRMHQIVSVENAPYPPVKIPVLPQKQCSGARTETLRNPQ